MMIRKGIISLLALLAFCSLRAQDMASVFTAMPNQYIPQLEDAWRKDLVELYRSGKEARLKNTMNGYSTLSNLTDDYLCLRTTDRSEVEMKLLPLVNNTFVVCMVTTVEGPVADSRIAFFTTDWASLPVADLLSLPEGAWYLKEGSDTDEAFPELKAALDMDLFRYQLSATENTLSVTYTTPLYVEDKIKEQLQPFLQAEPLCLRWQHGHFRQ
ncbi:MAG: DUF3256 family protein [Parabacteroides sp.]